MSAPAVVLEWTQSPLARARRRARRRLTALVALVAGSALALPGSAIADVYRWSGVDDHTPTDAIVVLGAAQYQGAPSPILANRLARAHDLVDEGVAPTIITVGGFQPGDITSEAQAGKEELVAEGLRRKQVIAIPFGDDTAESIDAVRTIAESQGIGSVTIVTDPAHAARAHALAVESGLEAHMAPTVSGPGTELTGEYLLREAAGLITVWLEG